MYVICIELFCMYMCIHAVPTRMEATFQIVAVL